MDAGDGDYVAAVSAPEDVQTQGKEMDFLLKAESCSILEAQETSIPREGNYTKNSVQEFMDLLDGKSMGGNKNLLDRSENLYGGSVEGTEDRVQELTLENYSAILASGSDKELMETMQHELSHTRPTGQHEVGSLKRHDISKGKGQATSSQSEMEGCGSFSEVLCRQSFGNNHNVAAGQSSYREHDAVSRNVFPSGGVRTKIISKSGFSEYFVKSTLKGKGVVCRGQHLPTSRVELKSQKETRTTAAPVDAFDAPVHLGPRPTLLYSSNVADPRSASDVEFGNESEMKTVEMKTVGASWDASNDLINTSPRPALLPSCGAAEPKLYPSLGSDSDNQSLREWLKSSHNKVDSLAIFRKISNVVDSLHLKGMVLLDLRPSCFKLLPSKEVKYSGRLANAVETHKSSVPGDMPNLQMHKRPRELAIYSPVCAKQPKVDENLKRFRSLPWFQTGHGLMPTVVNDVGVGVGSRPSTYYSHEGSLSNVSFEGHSNTSSSHLLNTSGYLSSGASDMEEEWYASPEEHLGMGCTTSSNIYSLGILLFELLSCFDSDQAHTSAMSDLRHRILPPKFLSENLKEAGFCLLLLHPEPSLRPTTRDILKSEVVSGFQKLCEDDLPLSIQEDETESELLLHFLMSVKEQKQNHASKLAEEVRCIEADIREAENRKLLRNSLIPSCSHQGSLDIREKSFLCGSDELPSLVFGRYDSRLLNNVSQLESAYFSVRSQIPLIEDDAELRLDTGLLRNRETSCILNREDGNQGELDHVGAFFDGLCKYARYTKLDVCGTVRTGDFTNSANVICSLSFDRDEEYFAAAGISKKVKIFEFQAICDDSVDIHYPVAEMSNKSKLSCICWNTYMHNYMASTDYDGVVKLWDAGAGQEISKYTEHEKRAWSVDFSRLDPTKLASGSDDCSVRLWSINERNSLCSIRNVANVCCVQFSAHSSHLLAFGSVDYKIYCYDIRNANVPWCTLAGHEKAVSYVKFLDSETLVSASTDNTLKLWDLKRSSAVGLSTNACNLTFKGHTNEKNFIGLSVADGYISCGSETNEVFTYYKSLPMPITSHKFGSIDPLTGKETDDANGQFVSSVCWRSKSDMIVAANSSGCIKVLRMI